MRNLVVLVLGFVLLGASSAVPAGGKGKARGVGLSDQATQELIDAGVNKYLGEFEPSTSQDVGLGWTQHNFTNAPPGSGPMCITGSPYSVFTQQNDPKKLLIFLQGGGACWEGVLRCRVAVEGQEPPFPPVGIWGDSSPSSVPNPLADYSVVYLPYCDGSVFTGDNDVLDNNFPLGVRFHRGLQNLSAGIDIAKDMFPKAKQIVISGSSAGGVGASAFAPFLARFAFGDERQLSVLNDAGPVAVNLNDPFDSVQKRADDWQFEQFYPASCSDCDTGQGTAIIDWRLDNDSTIREAFYSTDGDSTNRGFLFVPSQTLYRQLLLSEHGKLHEAYPARYKRFIVAGDESHTALQFPRFYTANVNGVPLVDWVADFLKPGTRAYREKNTRGQGPKKNSWVDLVEPIPAEN